MNLVRNRNEFGAKSVQKCIKIWCKNVKDHTQNLLQKRCRFGANKFKSLLDHIFLT